MDSTPAPPRRLAYTVEEAAQTVGLSKYAIRAALDEGRLPHVRFGARIVIPTADLEAYLADTRRGGTARSGMKSRTAASRAQPQRG